MLDYCGKNIKQVIETIGIKSELINEDTNFQEMDKILSAIDIKVKLLMKKILEIIIGILYYVQ